MPWTVTADDNVLGQLIEIFMNASEPNAVSRASNDIDAKLRSEPLNHGIASGAERVFFVPPLGVIYEVSPEDRLVTIKKYYYLA